MDDSASSGRTNILKKIIGFLNPSSHEDDVTEEEIISMVNEGHEQGVLRASEAEMIHNIFEFGDKEAKRYYDTSKESDCDRWGTFL